MAGSKDVLTVVGMLCVNLDFRSAFFEDPERKATDLVGKLRDDEIAQIVALATNSMPDGQARTQYIAQAKAAFNGVFMALGCNNTCPTPPCPCPDSADLY